MRCAIIIASEHFIYEPLTAGTLETMAIGVETSYKCVMALKVSQTLRFTTLLLVLAQCFECTAYSSQVLKCNSVYACSFKQLCAAVCSSSSSSSSVLRCEVATTLLVQSAMAVACTNMQSAAAAPPPCLTVACTLRTLHYTVLQAGDYFIDDPANPTGINIAALKPLLKENETATVSTL